MFFIVLLQSKKFIVSKKDWIENPVLYSDTKIFHSPNENTVANFNLTTSHYFHSDEVAVYNGNVQKMFGRKKHFIAISIQIPNHVNF